jgi:hypothetical protein
MDKLCVDGKIVNKKQVQVFIATTKGLVQVVSITRLTASDVSSVMTIDGTSQLAAISSAYQAFVEKPQGVIEDIFGGHAYRLNLSAGIDQGESWQLGVFIAHYLFELGCLADEHHEKTKVAADSNSNIVIIATGKIDTLTFAVRPICALAKKCVRANTSIAQWQVQQKQVCFLVPSENFRQPLPDSAVKLTPIASLSELFSLCTAFDITVGDVDVAKGLLKKQEENLCDKTKTEPALIEADIEPANSYGNSEKTSTSAANRPSIKILFTLVCVLLAASFFINTIVNDKNLGSDISIDNSLTGPSAFALIGSLSDNKKSCKQAGVSVLDEGLWVNKTVANPTNITHLCQLYMLTNTQVSSVWLVTDTKAIFVLQALTPVETRLYQPLENAGLLANNAQAVQWSLPLPSNQSQTRTYTLLAFSQPTDAADISALDSYLYQLHLAGESHSKEDLQAWINKTQASNTARLLQHDLIVPK